MLCEKCLLVLIVDPVALCFWRSWAGPHSTAEDGREQFNLGCDVEPVASVPDTRPGVCSVPPARVAGSVPVVIFQRALDWDSNIFTLDVRGKLLMSERLSVTCLHPWHFPWGRGGHVIL